MTGGENLTKPTTVKNKDMHTNLEFYPSYDKKRKKKKKGKNTTTIDDEQEKYRKGWCKLFKNNNNNNIRKIRNYCESFPFSSPLSLCCG